MTTAKIYAAIKNLQDTLDLLKAEVSGKPKASKRQATRAEQTANIKKKFSKQFIKSTTWKR